MIPSPTAGQKCLDARPSVHVGLYLGLLCHEQISTCVEQQILQDHMPASLVSLSHARRQKAVSHTV